MPSNTVDSFALTVEAFCTWAEASPSLPALEAARARDLLAALYHGALSLPHGTVRDAAEPARIGHDSWSRLYQRFGALPIGMYSACFDPLAVPPSDPTLGDLADDLADIYRDIHAGLLLYRTGFHDEAVWHWRFHFEVHWGQHALDALRALHAYSSSPQASDNAGAA